MKRIILSAVMISCALLSCSSKEELNDAGGSKGNDLPESQVPGLKVEISDVFVEPVYVRAGRNVEMEAFVYNYEASEKKVEVTLDLPAEMILMEGQKTQTLTISPGNASRKTVRWTVRPTVAGEMDYSLHIEDKDKYNECGFTMYVNEAKEVSAADYVPEPKPVDTGEYLVGCFRCPLWYEAPDALPAAWQWANREYRKYAERMPVLGEYNDNNPEVADWEIKWAVEHGISFFVDCWFRQKGNAGNPEVDGWLDHWSLNVSDGSTRYGKDIKFAIAWENSNSSADNITGTDDFADNLVPYWIETYFKKPNYMTIDGKPLFIVYNHYEFIKQTGGREQAAEALSAMREKVKAAGFPDVYIMTVHNEGSRGMANGEDFSDISYLSSELGLDAITSYNLPTFTYGLAVGSEPFGDLVIANIRAAWDNLKEISGMRTYPVASMGYDARPWGSDTDPAGWVLSPEYYSQLLRYAKEFIDKETSGSEDPKIIMLDNWNEYAEGHYIAPTHKYGFGHLDAVLSVFSTSSPETHEDLVPEDLGLGPYEYPIGE